MKKIIILISALALTTTAMAKPYGSADSDSTTAKVQTGIKTGVKIVDRRSSTVQLGVKAGVNMSSMTSYEPVDLGLKSAPAFQGGATLSARFGKRTKGSDPGTGPFGAQIELLYIQNSVKNDYADNIKLNYLGVPIMLKWYFLPGLNVEGGVMIASLLSSKPDKIVANVGQPWPGYESATIAIGDLKGFDVRPVAGLSYTLPTTGVKKNKLCKNETDTSIRTTKLTLNKINTINSKTILLTPTKWSYL